MTIYYTQEPSGNCPVQAEGTINGLPFYFRSRGGHWALSIAKTPNGSPLDYENSWYHRELYDGVNRDDPTTVSSDGFLFGAGWAEPEECKAFIEKAAAILVAQMNADNNQ